ncbi:MAG TPA: hypothetical protein VFY29_17055 [Terriglobia bacterium]|nr:hypothetical protein [Terriglobia bacterium]
MDRLRAEREMEQMQMIMQRRTSVSGQTSFMAEDYQGITYYYTPEDALCPYLNPSPEVFEQAPRPFFMFNIVEDSPFGVEMATGRNVIMRPHEWNTDQLKEVRRLDRLFDGARIFSTLIPGNEMTVGELAALGGAHFERYEFRREDLEAFLRFSERRQLLIIEGRIDGHVVFVDLSVTVEENNEVCGIFCNWNRAFSRISPGIYACVAAARESDQRWGVRYNVGHEYQYKRRLATAFERTYGVALVPDGHAILLDQGELNPIMSFRPEDVNRIMR